MSAFAVPLAGVLYGIAAFAVSIAVGNVSLRRARAKQTIDAYRIKLLCVTIGSAAIGSFAESRDLSLLQAVASALVVTALAGAICADRAAPGALVLYVCTVPVGFVIFSAALDSMWPAVFSALLAAVPFLLTALLVADRSASLLNAAVAAIAGASIGASSAFFVLCAASICALAFAKIGRHSLAKLRLAPYIAAFTLLGILLNMSILT